MLFDVVWFSLMLMDFVSTWLIIDRFSLCCCFFIDVGWLWLGLLDILWCWLIVFWVLNSSDRFVWICLSLVDFYRFWLMLFEFGWCVFVTFAVRALILENLHFWWPLQYCCKCTIVNRNLGFSDTFYVETMWPKTRTRTTLCGNYVKIVDMLFTRFSNHLANLDSK